MQSWDTAVDFLVVGSGAGGMAAAITANKLGLKTAVIEKSAYYGGTSALSGGVIWVPNNHHMPRANIADSEADAVQYLSQVVSKDVCEEKLIAFIQQAPKMLAFLEKNSLLQYDPAPDYPDYYAELAGGKKGARSLDPKPYSIRKLGKPLADQMRSSSLKGNNSFSMTAKEAHEFFSFTWRSPIILIQNLLRYWLDFPARLRQWPDNRLTLGKALVSRLRHSLAKANVPLSLNTTLKELIVENGKVVGAVCEQEGKTLRIACSKGILIASGGFSRNAAMRAQYHPQPSSAQWTATSKTDTGEVIQIAEKLGAQLAMMSYAWWSPTLVLASGEVEAFILGKSMPSCMVVNKQGKRFCNEAAPYEDFVKQQYAANTQAPSIPAYFICDSRYRQEYPIGTAIAPGKYLGDNRYQTLFESGWIKKADTLEELAALCGIDAQGLTDTAQRLAQFSANGVDEDFKKGSYLNDRYYSDHRIKPNPCLAPIAKPPFYAVEIYPGDLGTKGGLLSNAQAQVLDTQNQVIDGLYVTGNASASVMGDSYPGAGSTLAPAMTFGYIAAQHAARKTP